MSPGELPTDQTVRALAVEILERSEYAQWRWVPDNAMVEFLRWLEDFFRKIDTLAVDSPTAYWSLLIALSVVSAALIAHVVWTVRIALAAPAPEKTRTAVPQPPDFAGQARWLAGQGRFLEAAQRLQLATIELLVERGILTLARHNANRILRRRIDESALPELQRHELVALITRLERGWFRDRRAEPGLYEAWRALYAQLASSRAPALARGGM